MYKSIFHYYWIPYLYKFPKIHLHTYHIIIHYIIIICVYVKYWQACTPSVTRTKWGSWDDGVKWWTLHDPQFVRQPFWLSQNALWQDWCIEIYSHSVTLNQKQSVQYGVLNLEGGPLKKTNTMMHLFTEYLCLDSSGFEKQWLTNGKILLVTC